MVFLHDEYSYCFCSVFLTCVNPGVHQGVHFVKDNVKQLTTFNLYSKHASELYTYVLTAWKIIPYLLPLVDVANESREAQESQQA